MNTILFKPSGQSSLRPAIVLGNMHLTAPEARGASVMNFFIAMGKQLLKTLFCPAATYAVMALTLVAIWWHMASVVGDAEAVGCILKDIAIATPWAAVALWREIPSTNNND